MDAYFFYYSIYDRFKQRQPCVCMCVCAFVYFVFKKFFSETFHWNFTKFHSSVPYIEEPAWVAQW